MSSSACSPSAACATISTPSIRPSKKHNSSRASCSSSATTAVSAVMCSGGRLLLGDDDTEHDVGAGPLPGRAAEDDAAGGAVDHPKTLVHVAQADPPPHRGPAALNRNPTA